MKVMQINCVYNTGSTGKIVHDIHNSLKENGIESIICYGRGKKTDETGVYKTSSEFLAKFNNVKSRFTGIQYNGSFIATRKLINIIKKTKPDVVHLHCINGFFVNIYTLVKFLKKNRIKTVVTHHGEFFYTGNCGHSYECEKWKKGCGSCPALKKSTNSYLLDKTALCWQKMKSVFEGFDDLTSVAVSPWVQSRAEQSPIFKSCKHTTVLNGLDTGVFKPCDFVKLKDKLGLKDEKIVLYVTASFSSSVKGGKYVLALAEKLKDENIKILVIDGSDDDNDLPDNMINIGRVSNQKELAVYYSMADLSIITGKRETFSMPIAESMCCGTPVAGFKAGGPESITIPEYSEFVEYGDVDALEKSVRKMLNTEYDKKNIAEVAEKKFNKKRMTEEYIRIYSAGEVK